MSYRLSVKDIRFLEVACRLGNVLALTPSYDFKRSTIARPLSDKVWATFLACFISAGMGYSIYFRNSTSKSAQMYVILDYLNTLCLTVLTVWIILASGYNQAEWSRLLDSFQAIDKKLNNRGRKNASFLGNIYTQLVLISLLFALYVTYCLYFWIGKLGLVIYKMYFLNDFCLYYDICYRFLVYKFAVAFHSRYRDLNRHLQVSLVQSGNSTFFLKEIGCSYRLLGEMVTSFNKLFGWPLVFISATTMFQLLISANFIISDWNTTDKEFRRNIVISCLLIAAASFFFTALIMVACESASSESRKAVCLCYKFQEVLTNKSGDRNRLLDLAKQIEGCVTEFTAAGFFEINKTSLIGILSTTTTYFIVVIQFSGNFGNISY